jgi:hypothetical protein
VDEGESKGRMPMPALPIPLRVCVGKQTGGSRLEMAEIVYDYPDNPETLCIIGIRITVSRPLTDRLALQEVLDALIEVTKDLNVIARMHPEAIGFRLTAIGSDRKSFDEPKFFEAVGEYKNLWGRAAKYIRNIVKYAENLHRGHKFYLNLSIPWHDDEHDAGSFAIRMLVMKSSRYMADLGMYLLFVDEEHTDFSSKDIIAPIGKWGHCPESVFLLAVSLDKTFGYYYIPNEFIKILRQLGYPPKDEIFSFLIDLHNISYLNPKNPDYFDELSGYLEILLPRHHKKRDMILGRIEAALKTNI